MSEKPIRPLRQRTAFIGARPDRQRPRGARAVAGTGGGQPGGGAGAVNGGVGRLGPRGGGGPWPGLDQAASGMVGPARLLPHGGGG
jgi:hypothetical protein